LVSSNASAVNAKTAIEQRAAATAFKYRDLYCRPTGDSSSGNRTALNRFTFTIHRRGLPAAICVLVLKKKYVPATMEANVADKDTNAQIASAVRIKAKSPLSRRPSREIKGCWRAVGH